MGYDLGVDLGTTFVAAAISRGGRLEMCTLGNHTVVTPAVVYLGEKSALVFGEAAERQVISHPDRVEREFKRRLGDPTPVVLGGVPYQVTALMGAQLQDVLTKVAAVEGGPPDRVVLTHPANWGPYRRELFEDVPRLAGLSGCRTLTEPEAAAVSYATSRSVGEGEVLAVYDLGGGTFDASVLRRHHDRFELLGEPEGIERLGGVDFDEAILQRINHTHGGVLSELDMTDPQAAASLVRLRQECVLAKEALSVDTETTIPVLLPNRHFSVSLSRLEFEDMIRASVESTIGSLLRTLRGADVDVDQVSAVLLVGGSSRIPLIARLISEKLGRPTVVDAHPKYAVALGAATVAAALPPSPVGARRTSSQVAQGAADTAPAPLVTGQARASAASAATAPGPAQAGPPTQSSPQPGLVDQPVSPSVGVSDRKASRWRIVLVLSACAVLAVVGAKVLSARGGTQQAQATVGVSASANAEESVRPAPPPSPSVAVAVPIPAVGSTIGVGHKPDFVVSSPSGRQLYLANSADGVVTVFDTSAGQITATIAVPAGPPQFLAFSPDGHFVYISIWDKPGGKIAAVSVLDTTDNTIKATIPVQTRPFLSAVTADGKLLYVPNHDSGTVSVIDTVSRKLVTDIKVAPNPHYVAFSVDGKRAYAANHESNLVSAIDTATNKVLAQVPVGESPHSLAVNPKRPLLVVVNYNGNSVSVIDTTTNNVVKTIPVGRNPQNINWSPDGRFAYAVNNTDNTVSVISADSLTVTATIPTGQAPTSIAVLPDGTKGYVSNLNGGTLTAINLASS